MVIGSMIFYKIVAIDHNKSWAALANKASLACPKMPARISLAAYGRQMVYSWVIWLDRELLLTQMASKRF